MKICEVIYSSNNKNVLGLNEIDPNSIQPKLGNKIIPTVYFQYPNDQFRKRVLFETQLLFGDICDFIINVINKKGSLSIDDYFKYIKVFNRREKLNSLNN